MNTHLEWWQWALVLVGAMFIGISKTGIAGLGMLFIATIALVFPTKQSSGFVLPLLICGDIIAVASYRKHAQWKYLWKLFPWTAIGVIAGYFTMGRIDNREAQILIGAIVCAMVVMQVWRRGQAKTQIVDNPDWFPPAIGILAGFTTLVANAAGPLMIIYLLAMRLPKFEFVGTGAVFFLLLNLFKVPFMFDLGLISSDSLMLNLILAPMVILGAFLGKWLLKKIDQKSFEALALFLSAVAGVKLLLG